MSFVRKMLVLVLVGVSALAFVGCRKQSGTADSGQGTSDSGQKTLNIRVLAWKFDDAYGLTVRQAMLKYAQEIGAQQGVKINLDLKDAADSMAIQTDQATIMFAAKPDFVIINLAEVAAGMTLVNLAQENKAPFLFYNKEPTPETIQSTIIDTKSIFVGTSPREAGDMQGEILAELYAKDKSIDKNGDGVLNYIMFMGEPICWCT
jgi:methyl-galactoside transport system substrate-binding protein